MGPIGRDGRETVALCFEKTRKNQQCKFIPTLKVNLQLAREPGRWTWDRWDCPPLTRVSSHLYSHVEPGDVVPSLTQGRTLRDGTWELTPAEADAGVLCGLRLQNPPQGSTTARRIAQHRWHLEIVSLSRRRPSPRSHDHVSLTQAFCYSSISIGAFRPHGTQQLNVRFNHRILTSIPNDTRCEQCRRPRMQMPLMGILFPVRAPASRFTSSPPICPRPAMPPI